MAATGYKGTHKGTPYPVKPEKKKRKLNNSAFIRFLEILIIIDAPLLNRIMEFNNSDNDSDYNVVVAHAQEETIPRPIITAIEPQSGSYLIVKMKLYQ